MECYDHFVKKRTAKSGRWNEMKKMILLAAAASTVVAAATVAIVHLRNKSW